MQDFRNLRVWQRAHGLTVEIYRLTRAFPKDELYGLTSQLRRAASSMGANISEGCGRGGDKEFAQFLQVATGSASEVGYHLLLARDLGYLDQERYDALSAWASECMQMLVSLMKTVRRGGSQRTVERRGGG
ncbi:MAG: four helix bundle protein [Phycisphaerales bacterium]|nr:four helix bundle protein [Phycisphaerales bacterium]